MIKSVPPYGLTWLYFKRKRQNINEISIQVKMLEKKESKCKESRRRKIVKIRAEIKFLEAKIKPKRLALEGVIG